MAHAEEWRTELQSGLRPKVDLQWVDPDTASNETRDAASEGKLLACEPH
jgi:hypothetical protein